LVDAGEGVEGLGEVFAEFSWGEDFGVGAEFEEFGKGACSTDSIGTVTRVQPSGSGGVAVRCAASAMAESHRCGR
jgi:hypothetical protein